MANLNDLQTFLAVARYGNFTRAAAKTGVSQSAVSHAIRSLESRLGVRLLTRTTRSVSLTEAGERLSRSIGPRFDEIEADLAALTELRDKPAGTIRISAAEHAMTTVLWPKLERFLPQYPDIKVELNLNNSMTDIVADRFDAGVRLGEQVARDMIAVRIAPELRFAVVATPTYLARRGIPRTPRELASHDCINLRLPTLGGLYAWEFERAGRKLEVRVEGQLTLNSSTLILAAALGGFGLASLPDDLVAPHVEAGRLRRVLEAWAPRFDGYHLYYPSRRQSTAAFALLLEALRHHSGGASRRLATAEPSKASE